MKHQISIKQILSWTISVGTASDSEWIKASLFNELTAQKPVSFINCESFHHCAVFSPIKEVVP